MGKPEGKAIERMKRLLALVRRGEGGEVDNAARKLDDLLRKHGLAISDIDDEVDRVFKYTLKTDEEYDLFIQVVVKLRGLGNARVSHAKRRAWVALTRSEHAVMSGVWPIYLEEWRKECRLAWSAFIQKNRIFPADGEAAPPPETEEEVRELQALADRMKPMKRVVVERMLAEG